MVDALVNHPLVGSLWLLDATVKDDATYGEIVTGKVPEDWMFGHPIYGQMWFPASCIRRWSPDA